MPTPEQTEQLKVMLSRAEQDLSSLRQELDLARAAGFDVTDEEEIYRDQKAQIRRMRVAYKAFLEAE